MAKKNILADIIDNTDNFIENKKGFYEHADDFWTQVDKVLSRSIENSSHSMFDDFIKENAKKRSQVGYSAKIIRKINGETCDWCKGLVGVYQYGEEPKEVYQRHDRCDCTVEYFCEKGRQSVWEKNKDFWMYENDDDIKERLARLMEKGSTKEDYYAKIERIEKMKKIQLDLTKHDGTINIEIDEKTPCLRRLSDGKIIDTYFEEGLPKKEEINGWAFDWLKENKDFKIFRLYAKGDKRIQGMIALKNDEYISGVYVDLVESAPFNRGNKKEYSGIGGHLFAEAIRQSMDIYGYKDGFVAFISKTNLIEYYERELGARLLYGQKMYISEEDALKLYERYYGKK